MSKVLIVLKCNILNEQIKKEENIRARQHYKLKIKSNVFKVLKLVKQIQINDDEEKYNTFKV